jgi:hypothetical protein
MKMDQRNDPCALKILPILVLLPLLELTVEISNQRRIRPASGTMYFEMTQLNFSEAYEID